jgi:hypothetical protein
VGEGFLAFFFLPLEAKIQNGEWIHFYQKFCMMFSFILQNDGPKPKFFLVKWGTKYTLKYYKTIFKDGFDETRLMHFGEYTVVRGEHYGAHLFAYHLWVSISWIVSPNF